MTEMTAGELNLAAAEAERSTAQYQELTNQVQVTSTIFDYNAPLPPMPDYRARSWEPAARHYQDLDDTERKEYGA